MSSEIIEPPPPTEPDGDQRSREVADVGPERLSPSVPGPLLSTSGDDLAVSFPLAQPDPHLGEFSIEPAPAAQEPGAGSLGSFDSFAGLPPEPGPGSVIEPIADLGLFARTGSDPDMPRTLEVLAARALGGRSEAQTVATPGTFDALSALKIEPTIADEEPPSTADSSASSDAFHALDLSAPPAARAAPEKPTGRSEDDEDEEDDSPARGASWLMILLASYASALTIFLIWHFREHRAAREDADADSPAAEARPDPGRRADQSSRLAPPGPPPPIAADHLTSLGLPITVGGLEVTPLGVSAGPVRFHHLINQSETRKKENDALILRLRLHNVSTNAAFFPLDEVFLREGDRGTVDSYIEAGPEGWIGPCPLAVASEWAILGQEFRKLNPGETYETIIVSAPDARKQMARDMTGRLRLRTGIEQTDLIGVRFHADDVR